MPALWHWAQVVECVLPYAWQATQPGGYVPFECSVATFVLWHRVVQLSVDVCVSTGAGWLFGTLAGWQPDSEQSRVSG